MAGKGSKTSAEQPVYEPSVAVDPTDSTEAQDLHLVAASPTQRNSAGNNRVCIGIEDAEETFFLKAFLFRRPDGQIRRLGINRLRRYVHNVPPKGSKAGQTFQQILGYCKTAWYDMQTDGIWADDFFALEALESHELIAIEYVSSCNLSAVTFDF